MRHDYQAVFWDFGGVLTESPLDAFARYEREQGLPANFLRGTNAINPHDNAWARFERGEIDADTFDEAFRGETAARGYPVNGRELLPLLAGSIRPGMVRVLDEVRSRYAVACLTNNSPAGLGVGMSPDAEHARAVADIMDAFSFVLESSQAGVRKPESAFYERACEQAGVAPGDVIFLDDLGVNLKPARALGMTTIKVETQAGAVTELERLLNMPLRAMLEPVP
jgi:putative hydrolase of the HAD superfamily